MKLNRLYEHDEAVHNTRAAEIVMPIVFQFIKPESVLDVGCGLGTWLKVCESFSIIDYLGIDGDYLRMQKLTIPVSKYKSLDLRKPFNLNRRFDLTICLEVAEHLPEESAEYLVESLVKHSNTILFSAAIPGQGGQNHLNEQWPSYWQKKFLGYGFYFHDVIRPKIWENKNVEWWYRQNIFLVSKEIKHSEIIPIVHPQCLALHVNSLNNHIATIMSGKLGLINSFKIFLRSLKEKLSL